MDFLNKNWKEYIAEGDKILHHSNISKKKDYMKLEGFLLRTINMFLLQEFIVKFWI